MKPFYKVHLFGLGIIILIGLSLFSSLDLPQGLTFYFTSSAVFSILVGIAIAYGYELRCYWVLIIGLMALAAMFAIGGNFIVCLAGMLLSHWLLRKNHYFGIQPTGKNSGVRSLLPIEKAMIASGLLFGISLGLAFAMGIYYESKLMHNDDWWYVLYAPLYFFIGCGLGALIAEGLFRAADKWLWHGLIWLVVIVLTVYLGSWYSLDKPMLKQILQLVVVANLILIEFLCYRFRHLSVT